MLNLFGNDNMEKSVLYSKVSGQRTGYTETEINWSNI